MRVCIVTVAAHGIGGMQDHTRDLARGLVAAGHEVEVIAARHPEAGRGEERDGVRWHYVDAPGRYERLPFHHHAWLRGSYETFVSIQRQRPVDVIHSESTGALQLVRKRVPRSVPFTILYHGNFIGLARAGWRRARSGDAGAKAREAKAFLWMCGLHLQRGECFRFHPYDWMVPSHQQFEDTLRGEFLQRSRGHVVPNGIDAGCFRPRDRAEVRHELGLGPEPTLLTVGRLNAEKGVDVAIQAAARVVADVPDVRLVIVGDGEERGALEQLVDELGLRAHVTFTGRQSHGGVAAYMAAADVFLFPTRRDEAAPLVLPQAMACGAPVVASSIGGITEVVEATGEQGILIHPGDVEGLATATRALLADTDRRRLIGERGRQRILSEYTVERMVERSVEVYEIARQRLRAGRR